MDWIVANVGRPLCRCGADREFPCVSDCAGSPVIPTKREADRAGGQRSNARAFEVPVAAIQAEPKACPQSGGRGPDSFCQSIRVISWAKLKSGILNPKSKIQSRSWLSFQSGWPKPTQKSFSKKFSGRECIWRRPECRCVRPPPPSPRC